VDGLISGIGGKAALGAEWCIQIKVTPKVNGRPRVAGAKWAWFYVFTQTNVYLNTF
jgi:hypothetical protein